MSDAFSAIDAVIFDFGGVIIDLDYDATEQAMRRLLGDKVHYSQQHQSEIFDALETGHLATEEFRAHLDKLAGRKLDPRELDAAWNAMLGDINPARFDFLRRVAARRRIFLFSNTNAIHKDCFDLTLKRHLGSVSFDSLFERAYYSHLFGMRKPHAETYQSILDLHGLKAERTLFIDDSLANIQGAQSIGMPTVHLKGELIHDPRLQFLLD